ncbi:MAG TPA: nickel-binding protein, partial [Steroidobacteraceae bacterium]|nr:nickel-binding protein [Steroidobacteraceae bacterium]
CAARGRSDRIRSATGSSCVLRTAPARFPADVRANASESDWCLRIYRVIWRASFLSADGSSMVCWFDAPDREAVRLAMRKAGAPTGACWSGTVHEAPEPAKRPNVLVERSFEHPVRLEDIQAIEDGASWCLEAHRVKFAQTFFSSDRKRMLCLYQAPDAESVRLAQREARMPVDAVWAFSRIGPAPAQ